MIFARSGIFSDKNPSILVIRAPGGQTPQLVKLLFGIVEDAVCGGTVKLLKTLIRIDYQLADLSCGVDQPDRDSLPAEVPGGGNDKLQEEVPLFQELEVLHLVRDESSQHQDGHSALFHLVRHAGYQFREPR